MGRATLSNKLIVGRINWSTTFRTKNKNFLQFVRCSAVAAVDNSASNSEITTRETKVPTKKSKMNSSSSIITIQSCQKIHFKVN